MSNNPYLSNPFADNAEDPFKDPNQDHSNSGQNFSLRSSEDLNPYESIQLSQHEGRDLTDSTLANREAELAARERELENQREHLRTSGIKPPNFPFFYPIYYFNINEEIETSKRPIVTRLYQSWLAFLAVLTFNFITSIVFWASNPPNLTSVSSNFFSALSYFLIFPFPSFYLWYRPIYNAFMKEKALYFFIYLIFNAFHILFVIYMAIGIPGTGSCGALNSIYILSGGKIFAAVFGFISMSLFAILAVFNTLLFFRVHSHCKEVGHTFSDAKGEAFTSAASSDVARNAAGEYARQRFSA
ncbi:scamp-domain-containing protein [Neoconidiobolus thromboides FSU 785]|nr:scamp-domain-containing protein [Neoconidiobolus thromboides FSU 785]